MAGPCMVGIVFCVLRQYRSDPRHAAYHCHTGIFSWAHRPFRCLLRRYHVRKRRTDMWIHLLALPLLIAMFFHIMIEGLLGSAWLPPKMLMVNIVATAGWLTYVVTLCIKFLIHRFKTTAK